MTDYKALIGRVRDGYTCTDPLHRDLADAVEALVAENGRLDSENAKGGTIVQRAADIALRTPFSLQQATESLTWTTDVWQRFKKAETDRDAALKALGESRARFGDMEQRALAAEAVIEKVRDARANHPACDIHYGGDPVKCGWKRTVQDIDSALGDAPSTVLADHDKEVAARAWDEGWKNRAGRSLFGPVSVPEPPRSLNPYRSGSEGETR